MGGGVMEKLRIKLYQLPTTILFQGCVGSVESRCLWFQLSRSCSWIWVWQLHNSFLRYHWPDGGQVSGSLHIWLSCIWPRWALFGTVWPCLCLFGFHWPFWPPLAPFGPIWPRLVRFGLVWLHLVPVYPSLARIGLISVHLASIWPPFGPAWRSLSRFGSINPFEPWLAWFSPI